MTDKKPDIGTAYSISTPDDSRKLYADWAADYDAGFAAQNDYRLHVHTANAFVAAQGQGPVLDVGAGTGLCGAVLADMGAGPIDATDISPEMLAAAMRKDIYRDAIVADLTQGVPVPEASYGGVVSSGTFTTGHVGPDALDELLRVARPGALFALSINAQHFVSAGFEAKLSTLTGAIADLSLEEVAIYGPEATGAHRDDRAFIAVFTKA